MKPDEDLSLWHTGHFKVRKSIPNLCPGERGGDTERERERGVKERERERDFTTPYQWQQLPLIFQIVQWKQNPQLRPTKVDKATTAHKNYFR